MITTLPPFLLRDIPAGIPTVPTYYIRLLASDETKNPIFIARQKKCINQYQGRSHLPGKSVYCEKFQLRSRGIEKKIGEIPAGKERLPLNRQRV